MATSRFSNGDLRPYEDIVYQSSSESTLANVKRAGKLLKEYAHIKGFSDPETVSPESSLLIVNLIAEYVKFGKPDALKVDALNALIQGLRITYMNAGHRHSWSVDMKCKEARGNPLIQNPDLDTLRRSHRVMLAKYGQMQKKS